MIGSPSVPLPLPLLPPRAVLRLLYSLGLIIVNSCYHYVILMLGMLTIYFISHAIWLAVISTMICFLIVYTIPRSTKASANTTPGLYVSHTECNMRLLARCPLLSREFTSPGSVSQHYGFTSWVLSGDLCTLLPYLMNKPSRQPYERRWVRVPLAHGPLNRLSAASTAYEAVAVDYVLTAQPATAKNLLILAGLSGGSNEGYCLDMVAAARARGFNVFVMLGRGLADDEPCRSDALFHGARTSDASAVAQLIKSSFQGALVAVGISLGGIILSNGFARDVFGGCIDAAVSISGCHENARNMSYLHSRRVWQPILAHGLKVAFTSHPMTLAKLRRAMGADADKTLQDIADIVEFDSKVVTALNGFDDVYHYYDDLSGTFERVAQGLQRPLLALHAVDDPITHVDTIPSQPLSEHMFTLITSKGGHVGWPLGWTPWTRRWEFQNTIALEFLEAAIAEHQLEPLARQS